MIGLQRPIIPSTTFKIANEKDSPATEYFQFGRATRKSPLDALPSPREGGESTLYNDHAQPLWSNFPFQTLREGRQPVSPSSSTSMTLDRPSANLSRMDLEMSSRRTSELSSTPSSSATTFSVSVRYSHDEPMEDADDDVVPKIEEMDEDGMEDNKVTPTSESPKAAQAEAEGPPPGAKKRGRPRKHACPPPNSQAKVAKGRSKTGCITCRRRKKKCDETKPSCLNCQKNAVVCEGYPPRGLWKSPKRKGEEAAHGASVVLPRGLPFLIDGIETEVDRRFLDHFVYDFSRVLTLINDDSNPFKEILLPMATQNRGLMHSLMCLSGSHLSSRDPQPVFKERRHYHFDCAVSNLRTHIIGYASNPSREMIDDPTVASTLALCLNSICEGETKGEYRIHMDAARHLLKTQKSQNPEFKKFLWEFFTYHDVSNSLTALDRRPLLLTEDFVLPSFVQPGAGKMLGVLDGLFGYMSKITLLRDKIRERKGQGIEPTVDYQSLSDAVAIDWGIRSWEPAQPKDSPNFVAAQLYRQCTWVYLYRTIQPSKPNEKIAMAVDGGLDYLRQLPADAGTQAILLMPLFLLGCAAFDPEQRPEIRDAFDGLIAYSNLGNIRPAREIVEKVWEKMDAGDESSWDWETIIQEMEYDLLIT